MEISGKAAVVVGGASGMAKATAEMLVREGAPFRLFGTVHGGTSTRP